MDNELKAKILEWIQKEEDVVFDWTQEQYQGAIGVLNDLKEFLESYKE